jgi:17beta-estradiol 17-dehydrogenase / very-long-chain 3-oxoacyl-CoA reductase
MINTNITSAVEMTAIVLPGMLSRKRGIVLNVSSMAARIPTGSPLLALYAASKAALENFSTALAEENAGKGVIVECHAPFFVATKLAKLRASFPFVPEPKRFVSVSVNSIGSGADAVSVPYFFHRLQAGALGCMPHWVLRRLVMWQHKALHAAAKRKRERKEMEAGKAGGGAEGPKKKE